ncbi:hypothetical protein MLD38_006012 [Melastoma candidum]|uniref:Uncharacterized protein n=1 Tax=Melastoma candidum TaxID=119954 RepID=A0ACB9RQQ2_9MYRT|nr:hypothetical protein MLD38_006012 [Melastoma candidum]
MQGGSPPRHRHDGTSPLPLGMDWSAPPRKWNGRETVWPHDHRTGWSYCVTIPSWSLLPKSKGSDPVVFYRVQIGLQSPEGVTSLHGVLRRFNDFLRLFSDIKRAFPKKTVPSAPPKGLLRIKSRALLDERRCLLEEWMTKVLYDIDLSRSFAVAAFLELEAAARIAFRDMNQNMSESAGNGNSTESSSQPYLDSSQSIMVGSFSIPSDYGSDTAYETSDLGTPVLGRRDSSDIGVEDFALDEDLADPLENLVKYGVSNIEEGLFMGQAILEQLEGFPEHKTHVDHFDPSLGITTENGSSSKISFLTGNDAELFGENDHPKLSRHARRLSTDSVSSDGSSLRGSESSNSAMPNSSSNGYLYLPGGIEVSNARETCGTNDSHTSSNGQVMLPLDQRNKMNRVLVTMQRRLLTARTDMEDLLMRLSQEIAVKDYLTTKVKDLEVELESTKQKGKENLEQAILAERERITRMQWDMEELRHRSYELELKLKLKAKQEGETTTEGSGSSSNDKRDALHQELEATKEQLLTLQGSYEELEARSKADLRVLVKEVKSLRNSENHLKMKLHESLEEKSKFEKLLEEEREVHNASTATLRKLVDDCEAIQKLFQDSDVASVGEGNEMEASVTGEAAGISGSPDGLIDMIKEQANLLAEEVEAGLKEEATTGVEGLLRKILAGIVTDAAKTKEQANSIVRGHLGVSSSGETNRSAYHEAASPLGLLLEVRQVVIIHPIRGSHGVRGGLPVMPLSCGRHPWQGFLLPTASSIRQQRSCCLSLSCKEDGVFPGRNDGFGSVRCVLRVGMSVGAGDCEPAEPRRLLLAPAVLTEEEEGGCLTVAERGLFPGDRGLSCGDEESMPREQLFTSPPGVLKGLNLHLGGGGRRVPEPLSDEIKRLRNEFTKRSEHAATAGSEIRSRVQLLNQANELIYEQERELKRLWESVRRKEEEVEASSMLRKDKEGELKAAESFLEERTREWLLAMEELKRTVNGTSRWLIDSDDKAAVEGLGKLRRLAVDVRAELVRSWRSLASSRQKLRDDDQKMVLLERMRELEEEKESLRSYTASLKEARKEIESERIKLVVAEAQHEDLRQELAAEQQLIEWLQEDLAGERAHLVQVARDATLLQARADGKPMEHVETRELLQGKESELEEAQLEIRHLCSERHALRPMLEDKDLRLLNTREELNEAFSEMPPPQKQTDAKEARLKQVDEAETVMEQTVDFLSHPSTGELEYGTADLWKLAEACRQLFERTDLVPDASSLNVTGRSGGSGRCVSHTIMEEIAQLVALSEQLVAEAEL